MKILCFSTFISFFISVNCQNLVKNGSFEKFHKLQEDIDYIFYQEKFCLDCFFAKDWQLPTYVGTDYYNAKNTNTLFSNPVNSFGYHPPQEGNAYIGFIPMNWDGLCQHITGTLKTGLIKEKRYKVSFYIRHAGKASRFGFEKIGIFFHNTLFPLGTYDFPFYDELIKKEHNFDIVANNECFLFNDTTWTKIEGIYTAKGGELYFTLGVFWLGEFYDAREIIEVINLKTDSIKREKLFRKKKFQQMFPIKDEFEPLPNMPQGDPYYFIDNVSVIELN